MAKQDDTYWKKRTEKERAYMQKATDIKGLKYHYDVAMDEIQRKIDAEFARLDRLGFSKFDVTQADIKAFEREAKQAVKDADKMRQELGRNPTRKDFTNELNDHMTVYNATMRINRLEYLKSSAAMSLMDANVKVQGEMTAELRKKYLAEYKRQAGILGMSLNQPNAKWTMNKVMAQLDGVTFSDRIWRNMDSLKARLDVILTGGTIGGQNSSVLARRLRSEVSDLFQHQAKYVTERIARTESTRVIGAAQLDSYKDAGLEYTKWIAEASACDFCEDIAHGGLHGEGVYKLDKVPAYPHHPNCMCSLAGWFGEVKKENQYFEQDDFKQYFSDDERQEMSDILSKAPQPMQDLWNKYSDGMRISGYDSTDGSYFLPATGKVQLDPRAVKALEGNEWRAKYGTVFHEFGHYIDNVSQSGIERFTSSTGINSLPRLLQRDWDNLLDKQIAKGVDEKDFKKYDMVPNKVFYGGTQFSLTKKGKLTKASREKYSTIKLRNELLDEMRADKKGMADVSDMVQAVSGQSLGVGHDKNYYNGFGNQNQGTEAFAEMYSATVANPESLAKIKKYFPTAYDRFLKDVDWIIKEGAEYHGPN